jgi:hypothetical protein
MKRLIIALVLCSLPSMAFAVDYGTEFTSTAGKIDAQVNSTDSFTTIHTLSNNVTAVINWDPTTYSCWTKHTKGTKYYGAVTDRTKVYWIEPAEAPSIDTSDSDTFDSWTSM